MKFLLLLGIIASAVQGAVIDISQCDSSKSCIGLPADCIKTSSCVAIATWADDGDKIKFELSTKRDTDGYVAFGVNTGGTDSMGPASVMGCIRNSGIISVSYSSNIGHSNIPVSGTDGLTVTTTEYDGGELRCFFTRDKVVANMPTLDSTNQYTVLLATGPAAAGVMLIHDDRVASSSKVSLTQTSVIAAAASDFSLVKAHGSLMIFAWIILAGTAVTFARYYKDMWPGKMAPVYKKPVWFTVHVVCNVLVLFCTVAAFIIIFCYTKEWSYLRSESPAILKSHPYLGVVVTACAILNPIMALFRPEPNAKSRPLFNWAHWLVGTLGLVLGVLMVFAGLNLSVSRQITKPWMSRLLLAFVIFHFLLDIVLEIINCVAASRKSKQKEYEMQEPGHSSPRSKTPVAAGFRTFLIILYVLFALATTLALVIGMGVVY